MKFFISFFLTAVVICQLQAQTDSVSVQSSKKISTHADSLYLARLNNSGNLMIAGGVGLCGVGGYLIYQGLKIYRTPAAPASTNAVAEVDRNHRQGTIYLAAAGVSIAGGVVLTALGARNKVNFKRGKKMLQLETGFLDTGQIGAQLTF